MITVSHETVKIWQAAGIRMKLVRVKGGYLVQLR